MDLRSWETNETDSFDKAILVSGDGDFIEVVRKLKELKKEIEIWSFRESLSKHLKKEAGKNNIHFIEQILDQIEYKEIEN